MISRGARVTTLDPWERRNVFTNKLPSFGLLAR
jgi:hypothetical protein